MRCFYAGTRPRATRQTEVKFGQQRYIAKIFEVYSSITRDWTAPAPGSLIASIALASLGCSVQTENFNQNTDDGAIHAVVHVQRIEMFDDALHGNALAAFVKVPPAADPAQVLALSGLWSEFPAIGECEVDAPKVAPAATEVIAAELVAAEGVELFSDAGLHVLAPHAFPSAYDLFRGVVYSSRDQSGAELPASQSYLFSGYGIEAGDDVSAVELRSRQSSPPFPSDVTVMNQSFKDVTSIPSQPVLDFTWLRGELAQDIIVISLITSDISYQCSFDDREGFGTVPLLLASGVAVLNVGSDVTVSVHRVRRSHESHPSLAQVSVGFDFSIEKNWQVTEAIVAKSPDEADRFEQDGIKEIPTSLAVQALSSEHDQ